MFERGDEAEQLCVRMSEDLRYLKLFEKYPGSVMKLRFEDLVQDREKRAARLFQHAGIDVPKRHL